MKKKIEPKGCCKDCTHYDDDSGMCCSHEGCIRADDREVY